MPIKNITIEVIRKIGFISYFFNYYFSRNFIFNNWIWYLFTFYKEYLLRQWTNNYSKNRSYRLIKDSNYKFVIL
jgi:hypothetical protein